MPLYFHLMQAGGLPRSLLGLKVLRCCSRISSSLICLLACLLAYKNTRHSTNIHLYKWPQLQSITPTAAGFLRLLQSSVQSNAINGREHFPIHSWE